MYSRVIALLFTSLGSWACERPDAPAEGSGPSGSSALTSGSPAGPLSIGTDVVVQVSKTSFRQGTITEVAAGHITVLTAADPSQPKPSFTVEAAKVWPVVSTSAPSPGEALVCRTAERSWHGCTVIAAAGRVTVEDAYGERHELSPSDLVRPSEPVARDLGAWLARERTHRRLALAFEAALPVTPPGWLPNKGDTVVARFVASDWYTATVLELKPKGKARVHWTADAWPDRDLPLDQLAPIPKDRHPFAVGELVLVRPKQPQSVWELARITVAAERLHIDTKDGGQTADATTLVPFAAPTR